MKIIVRYVGVWGNTVTKGFNLSNDAMVDDLKDMVTKRFNIPQNNQFLKFTKKAGNIRATVRLVAGWPLSFYELKKDKANYINVELIVDESKDDQQGNFRTAGKLFNKLGIFQPNRGQFEDIQEIQEEVKEEAEEESPECQVQRTISLEIDPLEKLVKKAKKGNEKEFFEQLKKMRSDDNYKNIHPFKILCMNSKKLGWSPFHMAIANGHCNLVEKMIDRQVDKQSETKQNYTPLQLAIHLDQIGVLAVLLSKFPVDIIQKQNIRGNALHVAAKEGNKAAIELLFRYEADPLLQNKDGKFPIQLAYNKETKAVIQKQINIIKGVDKFLPPKPPCVQGFLYSLGSLKFTKKKRFFVLNPDEGVFMRFQDKKSYPYKPKDIVPLSNITHVQRVSSSDKWYLKKDFYYLEYFHSKRYVIGAKNEELINTWVSYIYQAIIYTHFIEESLQNENANAHNKTKQEKQEIKDLMNKKMKTILLTGEDVAKKDSQRKTTQLQFKIDETKLFKTQSQEEEEKSTGLQEKQRAHSQGDKQQIKNTQLQNAIKLRGSYEKIKKDEHLFQGSETIGFKDFEIIKEIGRGAFGTVYKVKKKDTGIEYAMKCLKKRTLIKKNQLRYAVTECNVLKRASHPFILGLNFAFQTPQYLYLILDFCQLGDLSLHLAQKVTFSNEETRFYIAELILAMDYLHKMNVIYRDLKPENILLDTDGHIKLADFGLSKEGIMDGNKTTSFCGSPAYLSPEMLKNKGVTKGADIYGIGAVMYELLVGIPPYYSDDIPKMYCQIKRGKLQFPKYMKPAARDLIIKLLERDHKTRIGATNKEEIMKHEFFKGINWDDVLQRKLKPPQLDAEIEEFDEEEEDELALQVQFSDKDYEFRNRKMNRVIKFTFIKDKKDEERQVL